MRQHSEDRDELGQLRITLYRTQDRLWYNWIVNRLEWFWRAPTYRVLWVMALVIGNFLSFIKWMLGYPTLAQRYSHEVLEAQAKQLAKTNEEFDNKFHRQALECVVVNSLLKSEMGDFLAAVPFAPTLEKKLRIQRWLRTCSHPRPPAIFIVGLPRTGSTLLHQLCGLDSRARAIRAWEFRMPFESSDAPAPRQARIEQIQKILDGLYKLAPAIKAVHFVRSLDPDECVQGFYDCALPDWYLWGAVDAPEAFNWYVNADMTQQYENYKKFLRVALEADEDGRQPTNLWLKTPHHTYKFLELARTFPEAKFVWIHRDPANVVGSCCSMNQAILDLACPYYVDPRVLGERTLCRLAQCVDKGFADREVLQKQGRVFVDLQYSELKRDLTGTMTKLYQELGLGSRLPSEFIQTLNDHVAGTNGQGKVHKYSLEHFGLTKQRVHREFQAYMKRYCS